MHTSIAGLFLGALLFAAPVFVSSAEPATAAAAEPESAELVAFKQAIRAKYDMKEKAFAAHDAATIVEKFYAEDAMSVGEGYGVFKGRAQLRPLYEEAVKELTVKVTSRHSVVKGDAGWDWADFYVTPVDPAQAPFNLVILFLWSRDKSEWMCKGDFYVHGDFEAGTVQKPTP